LFCSTHFQTAAGSGRPSEPCRLEARGCTAHARIGSCPTDQERWLYSTVFVRRWIHGRPCGHIRTKSGNGQVRQVSFLDRPSHDIVIVADKTGKMIELPFPQGLFCFGLHLGANGVQLDLLLLLVAFLTILCGALLVVQTLVKRLQVGGSSHSEESAVKYQSRNIVFTELLLQPTLKIFPNVRCDFLGSFHHLILLLFHRHACCCCCCCC